VTITVRSNAADSMIMPNTFRSRHAATLPHIRTGCITMIGPSGPRWGSLLIFMHGLIRGCRANRTSAPVTVPDSRTRPFRGPLSLPVPVRQVAAGGQRVRVVGAPTLSRTAARQLLAVGAKPVLQAAGARPVRVARERVGTPGVE
jgi:hypothetical protein